MLTAVTLKNLDVLEVVYRHKNAGRVLTETLDIIIIIIFSFNIQSDTLQNVDK